MGIGKVGGVLFTAAGALLKVVGELIKNAGGLGKAIEAMMAGRLGLQAGVAANGVIGWSTATK